MRPLASLASALALLALLAACAAPPAPPPTAAPSTPPPPPAAPLTEQPKGTVRVTASALNVRREPSGDAEVVTQLKRGTVLGVLRREDGWVNVRLADEREGWVAARFVSGDPKAVARRGGCPPDSDYAFLEVPTPSFAELGAHGLVVVEANVNTRGIVTSTKLISNGTGDEALAFLAEREIQSAKFSPPIRNCQPRAFIFTYRRTF